MRGILTPSVLYVFAVVASGVSCSEYEIKKLPYDRQESFELGVVQNTGRFCVYSSRDTAFSADLSGHSIYAIEVEGLESALTPAEIRVVAWTTGSNVNPPDLLTNWTAVDPSDGEVWLFRLEGAELGDLSTASGSSVVFAVEIFPGSNQCEEFLPMEFRLELLHR